MPSFGDQNPGKRSIDWLGILRTLLVQVLVLLALSGAFIRYLNWSSDRAWAEFSGASNPSAQGAKPQPRSATPIEALKAKATCTRRV